jgi:ribonuclease-3
MELTTDLAPLEENLKVKFKNQDLLRQALIHRSFLNENRNCPLEHNERLEFLGDAVLELAVTEYLYQNFPNPEGELTNLRSALVNGRMLAKTCRTLGVEDYLYLSKGEQMDTGKARNYILANTFEAIVGGIYLDQGFPACQEFILSHLVKELNSIIKKKLYIDSKTNFQEISQEKIGVTPSYQVLEESGPDHAKKFKIGVYLKEELIAIGKGSSKQQAQQAAAKEALEKKQWNQSL